eukprot:TRINITY_DN1640_c0_g1_i2.p1 TRINITY_DN1640_c0_g1~~TRINITY_DN1640_c0_g1_i2.p1  ORF type:complete len:429 (+),score=143.46 TRINITY_DN1640_c0_g1_i2:169-1287(+)
MIFSGKINREDEVAVLTKANQIECWNVEKREKIHTYADFESPVVGMEVIKSGDQWRMVSITALGNVRLHRYMAPRAMTQFPVFEKRQNSPKLIHTMKIAENDKHMAIGGEKYNVQVWDLETQKIVFNGRNVPHDFLDLEVPIKTRCMDIIKSSEDGLHHTIVTGDLLGNIRVTDTKRQKRPIHDIKISENPIRSVCVVPGKEQVVIGDSAGNMFKHSLEGPKPKTMGTFHGQQNGRKRDGAIGGSIRQISCHPTLPLVMCVSLDRHARLFSLESRRLTNRFYLKQRLTGGLFTSEGEIKEEEKPVEEEKKEEGDNWDKDDEDEEELWKELDRRGGNKKRTKEGDERARKRRRDDDDSDEDSDDDSSDDESDE